MILSTTQIDFRVKSCHFPSTSVREHEVGHPHTHPKPLTLKQFTSFISVSDLSLVRCFVPKSEEFVSEGIFPTVTLLLRTASWRHRYWISMCFTGWLEIFAIRLTWSQPNCRFPHTDPDSNVITRCGPLSQVARNIGTRVKITRPCRRYVNERSVNSTISGRYPSL